MDMEELKKKYATDPADKQAAFVPGISDTGEAFPTKPAPAQPAGENEQGGPDHT